MIETNIKKQKRKQNEKQSEHKRKQWGMGNI